MELIYIRQTELLLRVLPYINEMGVFALHGGTAINLFHDEMPRLSVDIDLTYLPIENRESDLMEIKANLEKIASELIRVVPGIQVTNPNHVMGEFKLFCNLKGVQIKMEVNTINRGVIGDVETRSLCARAQEKFDQFFEMKTVPKNQLFGGKIIAALDRQHPRDIFDTMRLLDKEPLDEEMIKGFLFCLLSSSKPMHEILAPVFKDQQSAMNTQFHGMTDVDFTYGVYEQQRKRLLEAILKSLNRQHLNFLRSVATNKPDWIYGDWSNYPGISWKLKNLVELEKNNKSKFYEQLEALSRINLQA
ncbi:nucleotidyl transferase AbiEii/AbiGii toxin family protein [Aquirufa echingensis]|uniref:Nucleotidyl transferase AbiEii/AbiGii toxin family protein n=1 Tax=Aquirufa echingensis TaxID=3096516 RepID=A0ABW6CX05_9BACT